MLRVDVVQLLLDNGANQEKADHRGSTPLQLAAKAGHKGVVQLLLNNGADPNRANIMGTTALHEAAGVHKKYNEAHKDIVKLLLDNGANPNQKDKSGQTPLSYVVSQFDYDEDKDMVILLVEHGAGLSANELDMIRKIGK